jgi:hypothetical protein
VVLTEEPRAQDNFLSEMGIGKRMKEQLQNRLEELKREFEVGQNKLRELESEEVNLRQTLLRISGAIQVLDEELKLAAGSEPQAEESLKADAAAPE